MIHGAGTHSGPIRKDVMNVSSGKRYFWLKLKEDFFSSKRIKKLRNMAGGDTYLIIYLKLQLKAMKQDGIIRFDHLEQNIADELALDLDENADDVAATLIYLTHCGLCESSDEEQFFFPYAVENVGSETSSAARVRAFRDKNKALHCNAPVTQVKQIGNGEKEIEKEKEIEIELEVDKGGGNNVTPEFQIDPEEETRIREEKNEILNAAEYAGFAKSSATYDALINLYATYGKEKVLEGIQICVKRGKISPGYLEGCLKRNEKKGAGYESPFRKMLNEMEATQNDGERNP